MESFNDTTQLIVQKVLATINNHQLIIKGSHVLVGISGGPDSVCLLHILTSISKGFHLKISALHVNHMLRGNDALADEEYVKTFCNERGIPFYVERANVKDFSKETGMSLEEAGREIRYRLFRKYAKKTCADTIALAHNLNDQAETLLLNMIRGTGLDGLTGIDYKRENIIRPLLDIRRDDIEKYCEINSLNPRIDSSNEQDIFTRNRIRLKLIPFMDENFNADMVSRLTNMAYLIKDDRSFLETSAEDIFNSAMFQKSKSRVKVEINQLLHLHRALRTRTLRKCIGYLKGDIKNISQKHIEEITKLIMQGKTGARIHLPDGIRAEISYGILTFYWQDDVVKNPEFCYSLLIPGEVYIKEIKKTLRADVIEASSVEIMKYGNNESNIQLFDYLKLKGGIDIRNRRNGDVFKPINSNGTKKLKKYFIDKKIPREKRDVYALITKGNEIVWIVGHRLSDKFKITENTKVILRLEFMGGYHGK